MSLSAGKRAAPDSSSIAGAKRPRTAASRTPEISKIDVPFAVTVKMSEDFSVYPDKLLETAQDHHESLIKLIMNKFETGTPLQLPYIYTITRKCISVPRDESSDYDINHTRGQVSYRQLCQQASSQGAYCQSASRKEVHRVRDSGYGEPWIR
jgi:hypothetical protein